MPDKPVTEAGPGICRHCALREIFTRAVIAAAAGGAGRVDIFYRAARKIGLHDHPVAGRQIRNTCPGFRDAAHDFMPQENPWNTREGGHGYGRTGFDEKHGNIRAAYAGHNAVHPHPVGAGKRRIGKCAKTDRRQGRSINPGEYGTQHFRSQYFRYIQVKINGFHLA